MVPSQARGPWACFFSADPAGLGCHTLLAASRAWWGGPCGRASGFVYSQDGLLSGLLCQGKFGAFGWGVEAFFSLTSSLWAPGAEAEARVSAFQGGVGGLGMPLFLGIGHPTLGGPGQRGVPGSPGAPCGAPPALTADICSCSSPSPGPLPSSLTLSPASSPHPPKKKPGLRSSRN